LFCRIGLSVGRPTPTTGWHSPTETSSNVALSMNAIDRPGLGYEPILGQLGMIA